jgi:hypothetical protein
VDGGVSDAMSSEEELVRVLVEVDLHAKKLAEAIVKSRPDAEVRPLYKKYLELLARKKELT